MFCKRKNGKKESIRRAAEKSQKGNGINEGLCGVGFVFMP
jgi:hypothetical protein